MTAVVGCSGRYELRIDGRPVAHGPAPYHHRQAVLDVVDLSEVFAAVDLHDITIDLDVLEPGLETGVTERPRRDGTPVAGGQAFLLIAVADEVWTLTDGHWRLGPATTWSLDTPRVNHALGWVEHRNDLTSDVDGDPTVAPPPFPDVVVRPRAHALMPGLASSEATLRRPVRIVIAGRAQPSMPPVDAIMADLRTARIQPVDRRSPDAREWAFAAEDRDLHVVFDLGQVWTGAVHLDVEADDPGAVVDVGF